MMETLASPPEEVLTPRHVLIKTWGCQMNVYDSGRILGLLRPLGYRPTEDVTEADLVVFNTCHIREKASEKLFTELGRLKPLQRARAAEGKRLLIAVGGCVAQAEGDEILRRAPFVDLVFGPQTYHRLPHLLAEAVRTEGGGRVLDIAFPPEPKFDSLPALTGPGSVSAFLTIQEGCDKFCAFCVVPYTRGAETGRPRDAIVDEARNLIARGAREITLLGQNVNAWRDPPSGEGLGALIRHLADLPDLKRLRYTTSHPRDMDADLIAAHRDVPTLMPFVHLPVQSGSDRVLAAMNRRHTADDYRRRVERLREACPSLALSTDLIVGFPGETEDDFAATLRLVEQVTFAQAYAFAYSPRPGTPAATLNDPVPEDVKAERLTRLLALLRVQQGAFNSALVGKATSILFEDTGRTPGTLFGRTPWMQPTQVPASPDWLGREARVEIVDSSPNTLKGRLLQDVSERGSHEG